MTQRPPGEIGELLGRQAGVITRAQALAAGLSRHAVQARLDTGRWQRLHFGVYAAYSGRPARESVVWAAVLGARSGAVLCHQTAAELYGLLEAREGTAVHVMVASGSAVAPMKGVVIHYSQRVDVARHPALEPPRTRLEETVLDLAAAEATATRATGWILNACASRRTTPGRLLATLESRPRIRRRAMLRAALGDARAGVGSILEHGYLYRVERPHGLPTGVRQRRVRTGRVRRYEDVRYEEYGVIVELDGRGAHPEGERWRDIRRDNVSAANGLITLRYSYADVMERPCEVADEVARTLSGRGYPGGARRCGPSCAPGDPTVLVGVAGRPARACG
jgi:Transcriptional regulator, AbiEi antitoxin